MAAVIEITDLNAPELAVFSRLTEAQLRSRREIEKGVFIAESPKVILRALDAGVVPLAFLMERRHLEGQGRALLDRCPSVPVYTGAREVLAGLTGYALTRGILCAMGRPAQPEVETICAGARRIAVLEGIVDATNIGAIFRSAAALYTDAVLLTPTCCDPLNRRAARVSMGTVFQIPWAYIGPVAPPRPGAAEGPGLQIRRPGAAGRRYFHREPPPGGGGEAGPRPGRRGGTAWPRTPSPPATTACASPCPTAWTP